MFVCSCVYALAVVLTCLPVCRDSGDDIELASCPHGQASKDCSMVASCSCELLSEGELRLPSKLHSAHTLFTCFDGVKNVLIIFFYEHFLGVYRAPERSCPTTADHYSAPSVRCREPPFTQHPSHMPLERFLQSPEAQSSNSSAGNKVFLCFFFQEYSHPMNFNCGHISTTNFDVFYKDVL